MDNLEILEGLSKNQKLLLKTLLEHPEGLLSRELSGITGISNKSGTLTQDVRELLENNGLELKIERNGGCSRWILSEINTEEKMEQEVRQKLLEIIDEFQESCAQLKRWL